MNMNTNSGFGPWKRPLLFACLFLFCVSGGLSARPIEDYSSETLSIEDYNEEALPIEDYSGEALPNENYTGEVLMSTGYADLGEPYGFFSHWFVGLSGGGLIYFADHTKQLPLEDRLSFGGEAALGKWWSPYVGTRVGFSKQRIRGAVQNWYYVDDPLGPFGGAYSTGEPFYQNKNEQTFEEWKKHHLYYSQFDANHIYGDCLINISNLFGGVNDTRFWSLSPYVGVGWMWVTTDWPDKVDNAGREVSANIGLLNSFRLANRVDLVVDVRGAMVNQRIKITQYDDIFNARSRKQDGILSASLGLVVHLGQREWAPLTGSMSEADVALLNDRMAEINRENASLRKSLSDASRGDRLIEWRNVATDVYIRFNINESVLLKEARVQLGFLARLMKEYPEGTYAITGYADEVTGTRERNMQLSRERADAVKNCLVREFGIEASRLSAEGVGGIENRYYNDPYLSRAAIIRPNK